MQSKHLVDHGICCTDSFFCREGQSHGVYFRWAIPGCGDVESSLLYLPNRDVFWVLCLPSASGCQFGCAICRIPITDPPRLITKAELWHLAEYAFSTHSHGRPFQISFMGQGEPLLNRGNIFSFCEEAVVRWPDVAFGISTIGVAEGIDALSACGWADRVKLQISIHALPGKKRMRIFPAERDYPILRAIDAAKGFATATGRVVYLSYVPLHGFNDGKDDAELLADIAVTGPYCVKISEYNPTPGSSYLPAKPEAVRRFCEHLDERGIPYYCFRSIGADYGIGCGQSRLTSEYPKPAPA